MTDEIKVEADGMLERLAGTTAHLEELVRIATAEIEEIRRRYAGRIKIAKAEVKAGEKRLRTLMKSNRDALFGDTDRVDLKAGALLHAVRDAVKRARCVTPEALEDAGYPDGVRIEKKVDWDILETWEDERLAAVGTERVRKEEFNYEIKGAGDA